LELHLPMPWWEMEAKFRYLFYQGWPLYSVRSLRAISIDIMSSIGVICWWSFHHFYSY
jgi:hypothetical protein